MTTDRHNDVEDLITALRDDLPSRDDERRIHARLVAGGLAVGSLTVAQLGSAATASSAAVSSTAASGTLVAGGAASAAGSLSIAAGTAGAQGLAAVFGKAALVTALVVGAGYPVVSELLPPAAPPVATVESAARGAARPALAERRIEDRRTQLPAEGPALAHPAQAPQGDVSSRSTPKPEARAALPAATKQNTTTRASTLEAETALIERALR